MTKTSVQDKPNSGDALPTTHDGSSAAAIGMVVAAQQPDSAISRKEYRTQLNLLQIELVKLQKHIIRSGEKVIILLEGRDAAGKDGSIKRIVEYLSPRDTRVVALGVPSSRQQQEWYFQRYIAQLPVAEEMVLFNRSWYNRAGVERVMGFCTNDEYEAFMQSVPKFEEMLVHSGFKLLKYYLDISKSEQIQRLASRLSDPLKQWKTSPIDAVAVKRWKAYSTARDAMLMQTHTAIAPWHIVGTDSKRQARLNLMRDILSRMHYAGKKPNLVHPDREYVFEFTPDCIESKRLAR